MNELKRYFEILRRRKKVFFSSFISVLTAAILISLLFPRIYEVNCRLLVKSRDLQVLFLSLLPAEVGRLNQVVAENILTSQVTLAQSYPCLNMVIEKLNLKDPATGGRLLPQDFLNAGVFKILSKGAGIKISKVSDADMIEIRGRAKDPYLAKKIAETAANAFLHFNAQWIREQISSAFKTIDIRLPEIKAKLTQAEERLKNYKVTEHIADVSLQRERLIYRLDELQSSVNATERSLEEGKVSLAKIKKVLDRSPEFRLSTYTIEVNPLIQRIKTRLFEQEVELAQLQNQYTSNHPKVKSLVNEIESTKSLLKAEITKTFASEASTRNTYYDQLIGRLGDTEIEQVTLSARLRVLRNLIKNVTTELDKLTEKETELQRLNYEVETLRDIYENLLSDYEKAQLALSPEITSAMIVQPAFLPEADNPKVLKRMLKKYIYFPKRKVIVSLAIILGLTLGVAFSFIVDYTDDSFKSSEEIVSTLGLPILAVIPKKK